MCGETPRWAGCGDPTNGKGEAGGGLGELRAQPRHLGSWQVCDWHCAWWWLGGGALVAGRWVGGPGAARETRASCRGGGPA